MAVIQTSNLTLNQLVEKYCRHPDADKVDKERYWTKEEEHQANERFWQFSPTAENIYSQPDRFLIHAETPKTFALAHLDENLRSRINKFRSQENDLITAIDIERILRNIAWRIISFINAWIKVEGLDELDSTTRMGTRIGYSQDGQKKQYHFQVRNYNYDIELGKNNALNIKLQNGANNYNYEGKTNANAKAELTVVLSRGFLLEEKIPRGSRTMQNTVVSKAQLTDQPAENHGFYDLLRLINNHAQKPATPYETILNAALRQSSQEDFWKGRKESSFPMDHLGSILHLMQPKVLVESLRKKLKNIDKVAETSKTNLRRWFNNQCQRIIAVIEIIKDKASELGLDIQDSKKFTLPLDLDFYSRIDLSYQENKNGKSYGLKRYPFRPLDIKIDTKVSDEANPLRQQIDYQQKSHDRSNTVNYKGPLGIYGDAQVSMVRPDNSFAGTLKLPGLILKTKPAPKNDSQSTAAA